MRNCKFRNCKFRNCKIKKVSPSGDSRPIVKFAEKNKI